MRAVLAAVVLWAAFSTISDAKEASIWVKCDGLPKPEGVGTTLARIVAVSSTFGLFGLPESQREAPAASGAEGVAACDSALTELTGDQVWARRVNMLRARALHRVEANDNDNALTDLRAANAVASAHDDELFFQRSVGVASTLFEAALLAKKGDRATAEKLAIEASDKRPYSYQIAMLSTAILALDTNISEDEKRVTNRLAAFNPRGLALRARIRERGGDPGGAADDYERLMTYKLSLLGQDAESLLGDFKDSMLLAHASLSAARAGRIEQAEAWLAELRALPELPAQADPAELAAAKKRDKAAIEQKYTRNQVINKLRLNALRYAPLIEATVLERRGQAEQAVTAAFASNTLVDDAGSLDLLKRLSTNPATASKVPPIFVAQLEGLMRETQAEAAADLNILKYAKALPSLEQEGGGNTYKQQAAGLFGTSQFANGFAKDKAQAGATLREITFTGGSSIPVSEELAMLRAIELARQEKVSGFIVEKRTDYQRYYVTTYAGTETSRTPTGFQTAMAVRLVDKNNVPPELVAQRDRIVDVDEGWNSLSAAFPPPAPSAKK